MSKLTHLCMGACSALLIATTILWSPSNVTAAPGGPGGHGEKSCSTIHQIALGENLTLIAAEHGVSLEALIEENGIDDANLIVEGQALCIPGTTRGALNEWSSNGIPGQSYDPNRVNKPSGYGEDEPSDGPQQNGYGFQPKPGHSYDPSLYGNPEYGAEGVYGGKADEPKRKGEVYWKDTKGYPHGGANFPDYTPSYDEEEPEEEPTPTPTTIPDDTNGIDG